VSRLFDRIGADALRRVIEDFYERLFADSMIGFLFEGKNKQRLVQKEWELTARLLGASEIRYTGRSMPQAHAQSPILGGHYERRRQILEDTLADHAVDPEVRQVWLEHTRALRPQVTADAGAECDHEADAARRRRT
jgi:hemoglobin